MSENDVQVQANLAKVLDIYKSAGVMDEGEILENIAFFALDYVCMQVSDGFVHLLEKFKESGSQNILKAKVGEIISESFKDMEGVPYKTSNQLTPFIPSVTINNEILRQIDEIDEKLFIVFEKVGNIGEWFDKYLIPHLSLSSKGGRYPTPRHLTSFMAGIVNLTPDDSLADFACGTGGMLVDSRSLYPRGKGKVTGIEISPNMARLAFTNLILNGQLEHDLYLGNAFEVAGRENRFIESKFDVIMMNPPFGASIDPYLIWQTFGGKITGRSETLFASLAYEKLKPGGRIVVLVPSGVLFSNGTGEKILREMLVEEGALRAIISLPQDSMQPVNNLPTHILFAVKPESDEFNSQGVWFYRPRYDGFTSGRNRKPAPNQNDLPLIKAACAITGSPIGLRISKLMDAGDLLGFQIDCDKDTEFSVMRYGASFIVTVSMLDKPTECILIDQGEIYRGEFKSEPFSAELVEKQDLSGKYTCSEGDVIEYDLPQKYSILLENGRAEIRKGGMGKAHFGESTKDEQKAQGLLLSLRETPLANPLEITMDNLGKGKKHHEFTINLDPDGGRGVRLLIFPSGLKAIPLKNILNGDLVYLFPPENMNYGALLYNPKEKKFSRLISYSIHESRRELAEELGIDTSDGVPDFVPTDHEVFRKNQPRSGVLFDSVGEVLGICVNRTEILSSKGTELQWEKYWEEKHSTTVRQSPSRILGRIKKNQNKLTLVLDRLLGISEIQPVASTDLPPRVQLTESPLNLQGIQQSIWEIVQKQTEEIGNYLTPKYFQINNVHSILNEKISIIDIQRTLDLFERMGMIVSVSLEGTPYYRLPEERDLVKGEEK